MLMKRTVLAAVTVLCSMLVYAATGQRQPNLHRNLVLAVKKPTDKTKELPGSHVYVADLANNSDQILMLQVIQMPGGYAGSGQFFACALQSWNDRRHERVRLWADEVGPSPHFVDVEL